MLHQGVDLEYECLIEKHMQERIANLKLIMNNHPEYYEGVATQKLYEEMKKNARRVLNKKVGKSTMVILEDLKLYKGIMP